MTENERKPDLRKKLSQAHAKRKEYLAKDKKHKRKEKTNRLTRNGLLAEKYFNCEGMNPAEFEKILKMVTETTENITPL